MTLMELKDSTEMLHVKLDHEEKELQKHKTLRHDSYGKHSIQCNKVILYYRKLIILLKYYFSILYMKTFASNWNIYSVVRFFKFKSTFICQCAMS